MVTVEHAGPGASHTSPTWSIKMKPLIERVRAIADMTLDILGALTLAALILGATWLFSKL